MWSYNYTPTCDLSASTSQHPQPVLTQNLHRSSQWVLHSGLRPEATQTPLHGGMNQQEAVSENSTPASGQPCP